MGNVKIKWKPGCWYEIRRLDGLREMEEAVAEKVAAAANDMAETDEYKTSSVQGAKKPFGRWRTTVITAGDHAKRDNAKNQTLLKALGSV